MTSSLLAAAALLALMSPLTVHGQQYVGNGDRVQYKDTSPLKLPAGSRVAIFEFEDLECPACRNAYPVVHAAAERYKIPLIRHDFPLLGHKWSRDAAITARYLQDKVSPATAEEFRKNVFASQLSIESKEDLQAYTRKWFTTHNLQQPFEIVPTGRFGLEVQADYNLGMRIGLMHTPTIFVLYAKGWVEVLDVTQLYTTIDNALAQSPAPAPAAHGGPKKPVASGQH